MDGHSDYCTCSPIIRLPTRDDLVHPDSDITHAEILKYRTMQGFAEHEDVSQLSYSELDKTKNQDFKCAEAGLAHYNQMNSSNYKLIEATDSHGFFCGWVWYHCIFKAAPETSSAPEVFFAELHALGLNKYHVITVAPVVNVGKSYYCSYCKGKDMLHPVLTLSRDPQLLYSEGVIYKGPPSLESYYQEVLESLKKSYAYCPDAYHNSQKISSDVELLKHLDYRKISSGKETLDVTSGLKSSFRTSDKEVHESLKKSYPYCPADAYHNSQKISPGMESLNQLGIKKISSWKETLDGTSGLKSSFRTSDKEVGLYFYKDKQIQDSEATSVVRAQEMDGSQSSTREADLINIFK